MGALLPLLSLLINVANISLQATDGGGERGHKYSINIIKHMAIIYRG